MSNFFTVFFPDFFLALLYFLKQQAVAAGQKQSRYEDVLRLASHASVSESVIFLNLD